MTWPFSPLMMGYCDKVNCDYLPMHYVESQAHDSMLRAMQCLNSWWWGREWTDIPASHSQHQSCYMAVRDLLPLSKLASHYTAVSTIITQLLPNYRPIIAQLSQDPHYRSPHYQTTSNIICPIIVAGLFLFAFIFKQFSLSFSLLSQSPYYRSPILFKTSIIIHHITKNLLFIFI